MKVSRKIKIASAGVLGAVGFYAATLAPVGQKESLYLKAMDERPVATPIVAVGISLFAGIVCARGASILTEKQPVEQGINKS